MFLVIAVGVAVYIVVGNINEKYEFLGKEVFLLEYGVYGIVEKEKAAFSFKYVIVNVVATVMCILSVIPLFMALTMEERIAESDRDFVYVIMVDALLLIVAVAVFLFVWVNSQQSVYEQLLQQGEFTRAYKRKKVRNEVIMSIFWMLVLIIYLGISFLTFAWNITWIIWPIAGIIGSIMEGIFKLSANKDVTND